MESNFFALLKEQFPGVEINETIVKVPLDRFISLMAFLKRKGFNYLVDITAVDLPGCFTLVYQVRSYDLPSQVTIKLDIAKENPAAASVTHLWSSANWLEREVYDMFGIRFGGHPNLKRILLDDHFVGHPLRKSYNS